MKRAVLAAVLLACAATGSAVSRPATSVDPPRAWRTWPALPPASPRPAVIAVPVMTAAPRRQPDPVPNVERKATPAPRQRPRNGLSGAATWYAASASTAAAGPALRRLLGRSWRGQTVTVRVNGRSVRVVLRDWCACGPRHGVPTLLDLSDDAFARLAPLSRGVLRVEVTP